MVLHAWIDFTTFAFSDAAADAESPFAILGFAQWVAFVLAIVGVVIVLRRGSSDETQPRGRTRRRDPARLIRRSMSRPRGPLRP